MTDQAIQMGDGGREGRALPAEPDRAVVNGAGQAVSALRASVPSAGVCAYDLDECTVTVAFDNDEGVQAFVAGLPGRRRIWLDPGRETGCGDDALPGDAEDWEAVSAGLDRILAEMAEGRPEIAEMTEALDELRGCMIRRPGDCCEVRKDYLSVALEALLSAIAAAQGIDARSGETREAGLDPKDESPVAESDAPNPSPPSSTPLQGTTP